MRVVVTGAGGQLGAAVVHEFQSVGHDVVALPRRLLDIADEAAVVAAMATAAPELIVNAAAWTDVDAAEDDPVGALNANAMGVRALARAARTHHATLVHYSTDFVFDGTATEPSKLLGEWFAADAPTAYVLRVESLFGGVPGGPPARGSVATIVDALRQGRAPRVFVDRTITPTYVIDAVAATRRLIEARAPAGLYHCVNSGSCTWYECGVQLAHALGVAPAFTRVRMMDVPMRPPRPQYCALSNAKLRSVGIEMPAWQDAVARFVAALPRAFARG